MSHGPLQDDSTADSTTSVRARWDTAEDERTFSSQHKLLLLF